MGRGQGVGSWCGVNERQLVHLSSVQNFLWTKVTCTDVKGVTSRLEDPRLQCPSVHEGLPDHQRVEGTQSVPLTSDPGEGGRVVTLPTPLLSGNIGVLRTSQAWSQVLNFHHPLCPHSRQVLSSVPFQEEVKLRLIEVQSLAHGYKVSECQSQNSDSPSLQGGSSKCGHWSQIARVWTPQLCSLLAVKCSTAYLTSPSLPFSSVKL